MRILIAIGVPRQSEAGAAGVVFNHARELVKRGHKVECWFLGDILDERPLRWKRFEALAFAVRLAKRISRERNQFDVVNIHAPWGCAYGVLQKIQRPQNLPPYAFTMQGSEEWFAEIMRREHRKGRAWNFGWKNRLWHRVYHQVMYDVSIRTARFGAIANRDACRRAERKHLAHSGRLLFVPNGVEDRFFISRAYSGCEALRLLFVGTWLDRKGVYYLADAFRRVAERNASVTLTVAGSMAPESQVIQFFPENVRDRVRVHSVVPRDRMPELYADHDIFVFPSLVEGMPLSLLEAMATGLPVVTTDAPGMNDVVSDGQNGILVPAADAESLAESIESLARGADLRCRLGREAQNTMRRYTWECVSRQLEDVLRRAVDEGGAN
jgi:glycosyltransferase involved in cell wall biosynthesis